MTSVVVYHRAFSHGRKLTPHRCNLGPIWDLVGSHGDITLANAEFEPNAFWPLWNSFKVGQSWFDHWHEQSSLMAHVTFATYRLRKYELCSPIGCGKKMFYLQQISKDSHRNKLYLSVTSSQPSRSGLGPCRLHGEPSNLRQIVHDGIGQTVCWAAEFKQDLSID